jgi:allantoin racemase
MRIFPKKESEGERPMRVLLINPNTSEEFTRKIQRIAEMYALPSTQVVAKNPASGPRSIESVYDEILSSPGTLELAISEMDAFDAFAIACYSDHPTVYALREITEKPVVGIAEASMYMACMLGYKFSVVTTNCEWEPLLWDAVRHYGLAERCTSVRTTGMPVLALEAASPEETTALILNAARQAVEVDGAEVICLGCAGMAGLDKNLERELGLPVVDGVASALKFLEGMVGYGLKTSKRLVYSRPGRKELVNLPDIFYKPYRPS